MAWRGGVAAVTVAVDTLSEVDRCRLDAHLRGFLVVVMAHVRPADERHCQCTVVSRR